MRSSQSEKFLKKDLARTKKKKPLVPCIFVTQVPPQIFYNGCWLSRRCQQRWLARLTGSIMSSSLKWAIGTGVFISVCV